MTNPDPEKTNAPSTAQSDLGGAGSGQNGGPSEQVPPVDEARADQDDGPGCMPAVLAATALMAIVGFIVCGFSTWVLFQKRTELAIRTLEDAYLPELQQSLLEPESKSAVVAEIEKLSKDMRRGKLEDWQSAGILQRLQRLPVLQWGDLQAVQLFLEREAEPDQFNEAKLQFDRVRLGVDNGDITVFDFQEVLEPVLQKDPSVPRGDRLADQLTVEMGLEVAQRAKLIADRQDVMNPEAGETMPPVLIEAILRAQIEAGTREGSF